MLLGSRYVFNGQVATSFTKTGGFTADARPLFDFVAHQNRAYVGLQRGDRRHSPRVHRIERLHLSCGDRARELQPAAHVFPKNSVFESITFSPQFDGTWEWDRFMRGTEPNDMKANTSTTAQLRGGWRTTFYTWTETFKYPAYLYTNYYVEKRSATGAVVDTVPFIGTDRLTNLGTMVSVGTPQWRGFAGSVESVGGQDDNFDEWSLGVDPVPTLNVDWRPTNRVRVNGRYVEQR